ncbi:unnamed protein product [Parascedosporium putredinis]|uniref:WKF domain-containing protein n=1 Tax=Parascedosporium putredinis TaxID=1442378 RepID=A0A9P1H3M9_9PEZI|nr:unnamed protein product [Parascedosporium putredinis]CAI7996001.1 unnamed protein product [Parascedosporium putredinis]
MASSTQSMAASRVPAWKRLGLKLKSPASQSEPSSTPSTISNTATPTLSTLNGNVRRVRSFFQQDGQVPGQEEEQEEAPKDPKKEASSQPTATAPDLTGAIQYLQRWKSSRDTWKFNKNHQTQLINHAFNPSLVPTADVGAFFEYIRDLKGHIRTRLRDTAKEIQASDMEGGKDHFPAGTPDRFDERQFLQEHEAAMAQRVVKRMRAEMVIDELNNSDSDETIMTSTTASGADSDPPKPETVEATDDAEQPAKPADGATRPAKRIRASKRRGADLDDSSSDESSGEEDSADESDEGSDSGSGSSSEESSSEEDDGSDDEMELDPSQDTSSSSSSSSSDDSDSDEEAGD